MSIEILENDEADVKITLKTDPLLTIGVDAVDSATGEKLVGGKYEIRQADNVDKKGIAITKEENTAHAAVGTTELGRTVRYEVIERKAPAGYKFKMNQNDVIGVIEMTFDTDKKKKIAMQIVELKKEDV